jgi:predicted trehalose synthase
MKIENKNGEITITIDASIDKFDLQRLIDYAKYIEAASKSKAKQSDVDKLADEVNSEWWNKNKARFLQSVKSLKINTI